MTDQLYVLIEVPMEGLWVEALGPLARIVATRPDGVAEVMVPASPSVGPRVYDASVEAAIEILVDAGAAGGETPAGELVPPLSEVGDVLQSLVMAGYQAAVTDIAAGRFAPDYLPESSETLLTTPGSYGTL